VEGEHRVGQARLPAPVKVFVGVIIAWPERAGQVEVKLVERLGPVELRSGVLDFGHSAYYQEEMGEGLKRYFLGFRDLVSPDHLVALKHYTNELEHNAFSEGGRRWANLDPGYLTAAKVVLATTKDYAHRLYVSSGIYEEVTLIYRDRRFEALPWTYPDYRSGDYDAFFHQLRATYMRQLTEAQKAGG